MREVLVSPGRSHQVPPQGAEWPAAGTQIRAPWDGAPTAELDVSGTLYCEYLLL